MKKYITVFVIFAVAFSGGVTLAQSRTMAAQMIQQHLLDAKEQVETRQTLDPMLFSSVPAKARTYEIAKEIPGALDKQFCYCYCAINPNFKHKSLLTCFVDEHASQCGICMRQALVTDEMTKAGKSPEEIAAFFKTKYLK